MEPKFKVGDKVNVINGSRIKPTVEFKITEIQYFDLPFESGFEYTIEVDGWEQYGVPEGKLTLAQSQKNEMKVKKALGIL